MLSGMSEAFLSETAGAGNGLIRPVLPRKSKSDFRDKQAGVLEREGVPQGHVRASIDG
jgi:hypothetical protein